MCCCWVQQTVGKAINFFVCLQGSSIQPVLTDCAQRFSVAHNGCSASSLACVRSQGDLGVAGPCVDESLAATLMSSSSSAVVATLSVWHYTTDPSKPSACAACSASNSTDSNSHSNFRVFCRLLALYISQHRQHQQQHNYLVEGLITDSALHARARNSSSNKGEKLLWRQRPGWYRVNHPRIKLEGRYSRLMGQHCSVN